jgi:replicative DNA helicase
MKDNLYSLEAEKSVIGTIVLESKYINKIISILPTPFYFYDPINMAIYSCCLNMFENGEKIDFVTVLNKIPQNLEVDANMLKCYLLDIIKIVPSMSNVINYAKIVSEKFKLRELFRLSENIQNTLEKRRRMGYYVRYCGLSKKRGRMDRL